MKLPIKKLIQYILVILIGFVILFFAAQVMLNIGTVLAGLSGIAGALRAIVLGCVMAYLLYPVARFAEHFLLYHKVSKKAARTMSTGFATLVLITLIVMFIYFIVPELAANLPALIQDLPWMIRSTFNELSKFIEAQGQSADFLKELSVKLTNSFRRSPEEARPESDRFSPLRCRRGFRRSGSQPEPCRRRFRLRR